MSGKRTKSLRRKYNQMDANQRPMPMVNHSGSVCFSGFRLFKKLWQRSAHAT